MHPKTPKPLTSASISIYEHHSNLGRLAEFESRVDLDLLFHKLGVVVGVIHVLLDGSWFLRLPVKELLMVDFLNLMLRVVRPLVVVVPLALRRLLRADHLGLIVLQSHCFASKFRVYSLHMYQSLLPCKVSERRVFDKAIDVSASHIRMLSTPHVAL